MKELVLEGGFDTSVAGGAQNPGRVVRLEWPQDRLQLGGRPTFSRPEDEAEHLAVDATEDLTKGGDGGSMEYPAGPDRPGWGGGRGHG